MICKKDKNFRREIFYKPVAEDEDLLTIVKVYPIWHVVFVVPPILAAIHHEVFQEENLYKAIKRLLFSNKYMMKIHTLRNIVTNQTILTNGSLILGLEEKDFN